MFKQANPALPQGFMEEVKKDLQNQTPVSTADASSVADTTINNVEQKMNTSGTGQIPVELTPEEKNHVKQQIMPGLPGSISSDAGARPTPFEPVASSMGTRTILSSLNQKYVRADLDLTEAIKVWKTANFSPTRIQDQVRNDIGYKLSLAEAKVLHKVGSDLLYKSDTVDFRTEYVNAYLEKFEQKKAVQLTPLIKESIEKIGQNLYRSKKASILWKMDMRDMEDGTKKPWLIRVTVDDNDNEKK